LPEGIPEIHSTNDKNQLQGVGQNKLPKWANPACQSHAFHWTTRYRYTESAKVTLGESSGSGTYKVEGDNITLSEQPSSS
jgi:hypothetical protein